MWREEAGIIEMLFSYIGEYEEFCGWSNWRSVVVEILSCHESVRRQKTTVAQECVGVGETEIECKEEEAGVSGLGWETEEPQTAAAGCNLGAVVQHWESDGLFGVKVKAEEDEEEECEIIAFEEAIVSVGLSDDGGDACRGNGSADHPQPSVLTMGSSSGNAAFHQDDASVNHSFMESVNSGSTIPPASVHLDADSRSNEGSSYGHCGTQAYSNQDRALAALRRNEYNAYRRSKYRRLKVGDIWVYICRFCPKPFQSMRDMERHERIHTGEKPYGCRFCPKTFSQLSNKGVHERCHTGEKPYSCSYCPKRFISSTKKKEHERVHNRS